MTISEILELPQAEVHWDYRSGTTALYRITTIIIILKKNFAVLYVVVLAM
jgi:hypothetical protein